MKTLQCIAQCIAIRTIQPQSMQILVAVRARACECEEGVVLFVCHLVPVGVVSRAKCLCLSIRCSSRACERKGGNVCLCVSVCERVCGRQRVCERGTNQMQLQVLASAREAMCVCVCLCVGERESEREEPIRCSCKCVRAQGRQRTHRCSASTNSRRRKSKPSASMRCVHHVLL